MKKLIQSLCAAVMLLTVGCGGKLASDGPYKGNMVLYSTDRAFSSTYDIIDAFLLWEHQNGDALYQLDPNVKRQADKIREDVPGWIEGYKAARKAYLLVPTETNGSTLEQALSQLEGLSRAAQTITLKYNN